MAAAVRIRGGKVLGVDCGEDCIWGFYEVCGGADRFFGRLGLLQVQCKKGGEEGSALR